MGATTVGSRARGLAIAAIIGRGVRGSLIRRDSKCRTWGGRETRPRLLSRRLAVARHGCGDPGVRCIPTAALDRSRLLGGACQARRAHPRHGASGAHASTARKRRPASRGLDPSGLRSCRDQGQGFLAERRRAASRGAMATSSSRLPGRAHDRGRCRVMDRRGMEPSQSARAGPGDVRRRHGLVPHAHRSAIRPGGLDRAASFHRSARPRGLVLPAHLRALERRGNRGL